MKSDRSTKNWLTKTSITERLTTPTRSTHGIQYIVHVAVAESWWQLHMNKKLLHKLKGQQRIDMKCTADLYTFRKLFQSHESEEK